MSTYHGPRNQPPRRRARRRPRPGPRRRRLVAEFDDPTGARHGGMPTYPWHMAPDGLATKRQLLALELRPGGQPIAAQIMWMRHGQPAVAYLYRIDAAKPKRIPTLAQLHAIEKALAARRTCPLCEVDAGYTIPTSLGCCLDCSAPTHQPIEKGLAA
ncbi:RRQRL motif-containing zinc-binding protein [Actinopolymorpha pittospori]|uniref:Uncharacterized protein n=1 Tax=Actinopolymorpha pittospori TaxID=648752 RepID=A0A927MZZ1_9ACTN|nr:RRQRL motif-containing zinc-binding protein [Actinopolymorpha pittospori]MBE1606417.1 hypothetical protein [Actinopolymorpha pittospori]